LGVPQAALVLPAACAKHCEPPGAPAPQLLLPHWVLPPPRQAQHQLLR
jgi:hypothetical protein